MALFFCVYLFKIRYIEIGIDTSIRGSHNYELEAFTEKNHSQRAEMQKKTPLAEIMVQPTTIESMSTSESVSDLLGEPLDTDKSTLKSLTRGTKISTKIQHYISDTINVLKFMTFNRTRLNFFWPFQNM